MHKSIYLSVRHISLKEPAYIQVVFTGDGMIVSRLCQEAPSTEELDPLSFDLDDVVQSHLDELGENLRASDAITLIALGRDPAPEQLKLPV